MPMKTVRFDIDPGLNMYYCHHDREGEDQSGEYVPKATAGRLVDALKLARNTLSNLGYEWGADHDREARMQLDTAVNVTLGIVKQVLGESGKEE